MILIEHSFDSSLTSGGFARLSGLVTRVLPEPADVIALATDGEPFQPQANCLFAAAARRAVPRVTCVARCWAACTAK